MVEEEVHGEGRLFHEVSRKILFFWGGGGRGLMEMPVVAETFGQVNPL